MDDIVLYEQFSGKVRPAWAVQAVDTLFMKIRHKPMWDGIDFFVTIFLKKHPEYAKKPTMHLKNKYGSNDAKDFRLLVSIPQDLADCLDFFYHDEIAQDRQKFYREFAKRYPNFMPGEKI